MALSRPLHVPLKVLGPVLGSIAGLVALRHLGHDVVSQRQLNDWLRPLGEWAPVAFVFFLAIRPLTLLPGQLFAAVGGLVFGTMWATVYSLVGSFLASVLIFLLARWLANPFVRRVMGKRFPALQRAARHHDFKLSFLVCINPLFPTDVAQAAAAASGARFLPVALGTLLGSVPGTFLTAQFGSGLGQGKTVMTTLSAVGMILSLGLGAYFGRLVYREVTEAPEASDVSDRGSPGREASPGGLERPA